jgi:ubiquinone/menaquinone biosynthesis C-methylase UbiE
VTDANRPPEPDAPLYFDGEAARYDSAYDDQRLPHAGLRERMDMTIELLGDGGSRVLDVGMGPGRTLLELDRRGWKISGVDGSAEMVAIAKRRIPVASERLLQARLERLPFPDASFDAVVATGVVEYVDPHEVALSEISRVLVPGGLAVVSFPKRYEPYTAWRREVVYPAVWLAKRLGLLERAPYRRRRPLGQRGYERLFASASLNVERVAHIGRLSLVAPLESVFPRTAQRLAACLGQPDSTIGRILAGQFLFAVRKPSREPLSFRG